MARHWTDTLRPIDNDPRALSAYEAFMNVDWSQTSLGSTDTWQSDLRAHVRHVFRLDHAVALYIGDDGVMIYNPASIDIYKKRHPYMMGLPLEVAFSDLVERDELLGTLKQVIKSGVKVVVSMRPFMMSRGAEVSSDFMNSAPDLIIGSWEILPLINDDGEVYGISVPLIDTTELYLAKAKDQLLRTIESLRSQKSLNTREATLDRAYHTIAEAFERTPLLYPSVSLFSLTSVHDGQASYRCRMNVGSTSNPEHPIIVGGHIETESQVSRFLSAVCQSRTVEKFSEPLDTCAKRALGIQASCTQLHPIYDNDQNEFADWILMFASTPLRSQDAEQEELLAGTGELVAGTLKYISRESALRKSELRFRDLVEVLPICIHIESRHTGELLYVNPSWKRQYGIPEDTQLPMAELLPLALSNVHPESFKVIEQYYNIGKSGDHLEAVDVQLLQPGEGQILESQEDEVWVRVSTSPFGDDEFLAVSANVSDYHNGLRRALNISKLEVDIVLNKQRADLAEQQTRKHLEFIDYFSHELRNPLGAIFHSVDLCLEKLAMVEATKSELRSELEDDLATINLCSRHMQRIMDDTLLFSQLQTGNLSICKVPSIVPNLFERITSLFKSECRAKQISLDFDISNWKVCEEIYIDPNRLTQVLINLITNSMKFSPKDRPGLITIKLGSKSVGSDAQRIMLTCSVVDNGIPMTDEELTKLFQRFQQANQKTHVDYGGSGLGLYICRTIVELLGGQISASRNELGGTTFTFEIPADVSPPAATRAIVESAKSSSATTNGTVPNINNGTVSGSPSSKLPQDTVILLVEDNLINQRLVQRQLKKAGYQVLVANNGREAVNTFQSEIGNTVDLCLCDIEMPVLNGNQTVQEVRSLQASQNVSPTPFLAISANARPEQIEKQLAAGMTACLSKPFKATDLLDKVVHLLKSGHI